MFQKTILFGSLILLSQNVFAFGSYCASEAQAYAQRYGGTNVTLYSEKVTGWYVNSGGTASYTYNVEGRECYISFAVKGTYFGTYCHASTGFLNIKEPNCGELGTWTKYKR